MPRATCNGDQDRRPAWRRLGRRARALAPVAEALFAAALLAACSDSSGSGCATGLVETSSGTVCGIVQDVVDLSGEPVDAFLGIPFAESTAGDNRWLPPIPKAPMPGVFAAVASSPGCPQVPNPPHGVIETSEDCLTVNVWRPRAAAQRDARPVLAWIYGGSFTSGGTGVALYDGAYMAAREDVLVVTLNYRVGALGFLAGTDGLAGNYGLMDQQLALRWVRDNIEAFGGNPDAVTIYGESAGAMSVGLHMLSVPSSAGLFRAGIMQSNPLGIPYKSLAQAEPAAAVFKQKVGCAGQGLDCLRAVPANVVVKVQGDVQLQLASVLDAALAGFLVFAPNIDGSFLVEDPTVAAPQGKLSIPTLLGTNHAEGNLFIYGIALPFGGTISEKAYLGALDFLFGPENTAKIVALYGVNPGGDNSPQLSAVATDYLFGCANRFVARQARSAIYVYELTENTLNVWPDVPPCVGQTCHGDDVPFVFHSDRQVGYEFTPDEARLSDQMVGYWATMATRLEPNRSGSFFWPPFTPDGLDYLILDEPGLSTAVDPIQNCDFWDGIGYEVDGPFRGLAAAAAAASAAAD